MNKYYTPDIEEFHVGFEFEHNIATITPAIFDFSKEGAVTRLDDKAEDIWDKKVWSAEDNMTWFNVKHFCDKPMEWSVPDIIRVKYLDTNDIESLGFKKSGLGSDKTTLKMFSGEGKELKGYWITHHFANQETEIVDTRLEFHLMKFSGKIKNKSELKRILKQIGYADV